MLVSDNTTNELNNNKSDDFSSDSEKDKISDESVNKEVKQINGQTNFSSFSVCSDVTNGNSAKSVDDIVSKTNQQILDEVKNRKRTKYKRKCEYCDYQKLNVSNCNLKVYEVQSSMHTNCLVELNLSNNNIEQFPEIITELVNLTVLNLSYNKLQTLPNSCILLKKLRYLNLSHNQIGYDPPKCLELGLDFIKHLDLGYNLICSFNYPPKCLIFLEYLNLSRNYLEYPPSWLFGEKCRSLKKLDLSYSLIINRYFQTRLQETKLLRSSFLKSVESLSLTNCSLSIPVLDVIKNFENLNSLNIGNEFKKVPGPWKDNTIWDLPVTIFSKLENITELHIYDVGMPTLPSDLCLLKNLKVLDASNNLLTWLPDAFVKLECLEVIKLKCNKLIHLPLHFNQMVSIRELHLSDNKLTNVEDLEPLCNLEVVDLYNNCLEAMPVSDTQLRRLSKIDVAYNHFSVETCLNHNFEDGCSALEFYKKLEENLRSSLGVSEYRNSGTCPVSYQSNDSSDCSYSRESYSSSSREENYEEVYDNSEPEDNGDNSCEGHFEVEEEDWNVDSDNDFDPHLCSPREKVSKSVIIQRSTYSTPQREYVRDREHYFLPSKQYLTRPRRPRLILDVYPNQFSDVDSS